MTKFHDTGFFRLWFAYVNTYLTLEIQNLFIMMNNEIKYVLLHCLLMLLS